MKKSLFTKILCVMVAVASTFLFTGCGDKGIKVPGFDKTANIKIGVSGPLTGGAAIYGQAVNNGAKLAVKEINDNGGLDGLMFSFEMYDDQHDASKVPTNYYAMAEAGMQISLGCVTSTPCLEFKSLAVEDNMFIMTPSATADKVYENASNVYQMCFSDNGQGTASATYVAQNYATAKVGVFYKVDDAYSKGIFDNFKASYAGNWADVVVTEFTKDTALDFSAQVAQLAACDFVFMPIYYEDASLFMTQAQNKIANTAVFFGCDGFDGITALEGFDVNTIKQEISYLSHFDASATTGKTGEFIANYNKVFKPSSLNQFGASAYDCVYAIFEALKVAKANGKTFSGSTSASDMCNILTEVLQNGTFTFNGVTGTNIKWNADGTVNKAPVKYVVKSAS